jgi:hypothetical protein
MVIQASVRLDAHKREEQSGQGQKCLKNCSLKSLALSNTRDRAAEKKDNLMNLKYHIFKVS